MCGIAITFPRYNRDVKKMVKILEHRGLYSKTDYINGFGLGHVRLPINGIDFKYDCPYYSDPNYYLYNGEIYNYKEYERTIPYESDIQTVVDQDMSGLDGDYVIALYDHKADQVRIATDRLGRRSLYYRQNDAGRIEAVASEMKALVDEDTAPNMMYYATVGKHGYYFVDGSTPFWNIKKFYNDAVYIIDRNGKVVDFHFKKFNSRNQIPTAMKKNTWSLDYGRDLIELSLKRRLTTSDVPVSVLYSGGLDSTIIMWHIGNFIKSGVINNIEVFTIENSDDQKYAEDYCKELNINLNVLKFSDLTEEEYDSIVDAAHIASESACDLGSVVSNYMLFREVSRKGYNVVITGDGADELFGGYKRMQNFDFQYNDIFNELEYYHLPRLDKLAMAHTLEYRSPYTADYILDLALNLPYEWRVGKRFLKEAYKGLIPEEIRIREKTPLKAANIIANKEGERIKLLNDFYDIYANEIIKRSMQ